MEITAEIMPLSVFPPEERQLFSDWAWKFREQTQFDMDVLAAPRACIARAESEGKPVLYVPVQPVLMLESLCPYPELTKNKKALALWRIVEQMDDVMRCTGMMETYFVTQDDQFAERAIAAGFTEVKGHVLKRKLNATQILS